MPTDQELDAVDARTEEILKELEERRREYAELQQAREDLAAEYGLTADELTEKSRQLVEKIRQNGTPEQKAQLAQVEADEKRKHEEAVARIKADTEEQLQARWGGTRKHARVRNTV